MDTLFALLEALHADPRDDAVRLVLGDWLEENGRAEQAELLRLHLRLWRAWEDRPSPALFARLCGLLRQGVRPVVPARTNSLGMRFALISPGVFWMGSPRDEPHRFADEGPEHLVEITRPFYLGVFPVTQGEYTAACAFNPSHFREGMDGPAGVPVQDTSRHPVENLSWESAREFCDVLNRNSQERKAKRRYRLPSEAEWEYACRAGISRAGPYHWGQTVSTELANIRGEDYAFNPAVEQPAGGTVPVDAYPPNAFGLFDLHGNVSEWCSDWFDAEFYSNSPLQDPTGPSQGEFRILRGGCWKDGPEFARTAFRYDRPPEHGRYDFGVRVVLEHPAG